MCVWIDSDIFAAKNNLMDPVFAGFVIFLFTLAVFDLWVGVSNDAVNFLNSAIGSKAAKYKVILTIAAVGIFFGATTSNGMMDIARNGILNPHMFSFEHVMYIFLAVMATDIILLDVFNTLGMPTSTTVSMVFELLGATFAFALMQSSLHPEAGDISEYMNTGKALSVIMAIFVSVAIAFFFGLVLQYIARLVFTFRFTKGLKWKIGIFGGIAVTAIIYFMLIKGLKGMSFMTEDVQKWITDNTSLIITGCFVFFSILMQILHLLKVNVLKVIVLIGTFSLATAFAGNDLVNFIGVPLSGFSSYIEYTGSGADDPSLFMMDSLNEPASTPTIFLVAAGAVMVFALLKSKKAQNVTKTEIGLARQDTGEEMFGSSKAARSIVRMGNAVAVALDRITPERTKKWIEKRFQTTEIDIEEGAAYDLIRASVNLVVASLLIALGTSLKLPLSTTYVTFMVAMGSSLADRAWGRESAVFRITGVLSVIGGWFITAGAAFTICFIMALIMYFGGYAAAFAIAAISILILIKNNVSTRKKKRENRSEEESDRLFSDMMKSKNGSEIYPLLSRHIRIEQISFLKRYAGLYEDITSGLTEENARKSRKACMAARKDKYLLKNLRKKETICLSKMEKSELLEKSTWFHMMHNGMEQMYYSIRRAAESVHEHIENNFSPLAPEFKAELEETSRLVIAMVQNAMKALEENGNASFSQTISECSEVQEKLAKTIKRTTDSINREGTNLNMAYLYLNILQESEQFTIQLKQVARGSEKFFM